MQTPKVTEISPEAIAHTRRALHLRQVRLVRESLLRGHLAERKR